MNMKALSRILIAGIAVVALFTGTVAAQIVVIGTGDPDIDIAAVQSAVDQGGSIVLRGHFSFDNPPTRHGALEGLMAVILVSKQVTISGAWDERGEMTAIHGGEIPFAVEAPGADVRIKGLRFVRPKRSAIFVDAVNGLAIESCAIESVEPLPPLWNSAGVTIGVGIHVATLFGLPSPERPGKPENVYGKVSILNNEISVNGAADEGIGIMIVSLGDSEKPVDVDVSGNTIRDSTLKGIDVMQIGGQARIERNIVTTNVVYRGPAGGFSSGIFCGRSGSYRIAYNLISMADPNGAGIRVLGTPALGAATEHATITDNDVTMSAPEGSVFGVRSAGIEIKGLARDTVVQRNRIRGHARVALLVGPGKTGYPTGNTFDRNNKENFISPLADGGKQK
jgi:Right handed beta helix region